MEADFTPERPNFKIVQNNILIARPKKLEQGNVKANQRHFLLFTTRAL
jgi:hypothetical protein